jgi:hypothetical protein
MMSEKNKNLMSARVDCWQKDCAAYDYCETTNMSCEETRLQMVPDSSVLASHDKQATQIAQLKKQLATETAERKRLEDNEDAMVAYHDELCRDLAEADDAIDRVCRKCICSGMYRAYSERCGDCDISDTAEKAKARIEARK